MVWEGRGIGVIFVGRDFVGEFSHKDIALLRTFADQAVIAIQNARLFNETQESLAQADRDRRHPARHQRSPTDVQPVYDAIVETAVRLMSCDHGFVLRTDGRTFSPVRPDARRPQARAFEREVAVDPRTTFRRGRSEQAAAAHPDWNAIELPRTSARSALRGTCTRRCRSAPAGGECIGVLASCAARQGRSRLARSRSRARSPTRR
jgi:hypothetical protein